MGTYDKEKQSAIDIVRKLGQIHLSRMNDGNIPYPKTDTSIVTIVDIESQKAALKILEKKFRECAVLAEEDTPIDLEPFQRNDPTNRCWTIDPLDGTSNYRKHLPFFGAIAGYRVYNKFVVAALYQPVTDTLYLAAEGEGVRKFTSADKSTGIEMRITDPDHPPQIHDEIHIKGFDPDFISFLNERSGGIQFHHIRDICSIDRTIQVLEGRKKAYFKSKGGNIYGLGPESFIIESAQGAFINLNGEPPKWLPREIENPDGKKRTILEIDSHVILGPGDYSKKLADKIQKILPTYRDW